MSKITRHIQLGNTGAKYLSTETKLQTAQMSRFPYIKPFNIAFDPIGVRQGNRLHWTILS